MSDDMTTLGVRVPTEIAERLDALIERLPRPAGGTSLNRSVAIRLALEEGIAVLEKKHPAPPARSKR